MKNKNIKQDLVAVVVDTYYGWQEPRKAFYNSARNLVRGKIEDLPMRLPEEKRENKAYVNRYVDSNMEDLLVEIMGGDLSEFEEKYIQEFLDSGKALKEQEKKAQAMMDEYLLTEPVWMWLKEIRGISRVLAINLIRFFDFSKADHISSFWKYAGLHVSEDGVAPGRKRGEKLEYNARAKTLMWKVADSFVKQRTSPYREIYDEYKERQLSRVFKEEELKNKFKGYKKEDIHLSKGHAHNRAMRYIGKEFLKDYYIKLCELNGKILDKPYSARFHEAKR